jgi:phosphomannomutase
LHVNAVVDEIVNYGCGFAVDKEADRCIVVTTPIQVDAIVDEIVNRSCGFTFNNIADSFANSATRLKVIDAVVDEIINCSYRFAIDEDADRCIVGTIRI